jgi:hypothetical protein
MNESPNFDMFGCYNDDVPAEQVTAYARGGEC